ncbi:MAG: FHA domain-containing protein, partial [Pseudomonadota bacterium]
HLRIRRGRDGYTIEDLASKNGTKVNGRSLNPGEEVLIHSGDQIRIGGSTFDFLSYDGMRSSERSQRPKGEQWILSGIDPQSGNQITIAFDEAVVAGRGGQLVVGRDGDACDFSIPHPTVSGSGHAKLTIEADNLILTDMGSTNGTKVNGQRLGHGGTPMSMPLTPGASVMFGNVTLQVSKNS